MDEKKTKTKLKVPPHPWGGNCTPAGCTGHLGFHCHMLGSQQHLLKSMKKTCRVSAQHQDCHVLLVHLQQGEPLDVYKMASRKLLGSMFVSKLSQSRSTGPPSAAPPRSIRDHDSHTLTGEKIGPRFERCKLQFPWCHCGINAPCAVIFLNVSVHLDQRLTLTSLAEGAYSIASEFWNSTEKEEIRQMWSKHKAEVNFHYWWISQSAVW